MSASLTRCRREQLTEELQQLVEEICQGGKMSPRGQGSCMSIKYRINTRRYFGYFRVMDWISSDFVDWGLWMNLFVPIHSSNCHKGSSSLVAVLRVMCSLSVVDKAISVWNLLPRTTGHLKNTMAYHVWDKMLSLRWECMQNALHTTYLQSLHKRTYLIKNR